MGAWVGGRAESSVAGEKMSPAFHPKDTVSHPFSVVHMPLGCLGSFHSPRKKQSRRSVLLYEINTQSASARRAACSEYVYEVD